MFQLLETIKISNNILRNISYHNKRVNDARYHLFKISESWNLEESIPLTGLIASEIYKCRIIYGTKIKSVEINPYIFAPLKSLRLVQDESIEYDYKYLDRHKLNQLRNKADGADDVLIVKNDFITDTSFANIVFFDGNRWITPANPLLKGTNRQYYIDQNIIFEKEIKIRDLPFFKKARIINAMIDLEESEDIEICNIIQ